MKAYKLVRIRKDGTLGSLFIHKRAVLPIGVWLEAESHKTPGFAVRPGWHCTRRMHAPHLSKKGRAWCRCEIEDFVEHLRPKSQGGMWYLARRMRITSVAVKYPT